MTGVGWGVYTCASGPTITKACIHVRPPHPHKKRWTPHNADQHQSPTCQVSHAERSAYLLAGGAGDLREAVLQPEDLIIVVVIVG